MLSPDSAVVLGDLGIDPGDLTRVAGLPEDLFSRETIRLDPEEYFRLWTGLNELVGDPLLPLRMARAVTAESFSPPVFAALCSRDFITAVARLAQHKRLIGPITPPIHSNALGERLPQSVPRYERVRVGPLRHTRIGGRVPARKQPARAAVSISISIPS